MPPRRMIKSPTPREEEAVAAVEQAAVVKAAPTGTEALGAEQMKAANDLFKSGEFLKAAGMYTKAAKNDPSNAVIHCNLAYALLKVNKFDKAVAAADSCLALDPESFKGHFRKGLATYGALEFEKSVDCFASAVDKSPENSPARREAKQMLQRAKWACKKNAEKQKQEVPANSADATNPDEDKENELTPKEKWEKAKDDFAAAKKKAKDDKNAAIDSAKDVKNDAIQKAKDEFNEAKQQNKSLPKNEKKKADKAAKNEFNAAKKTANDDFKSAKNDANAQYKSDLDKAKSDYNDAKTEWKSSK